MSSLATFYLLSEDELPRLLALRSPTSMPPPET